jgi:hypothetical protein
MAFMPSRLCSEGLRIAAEPLPVSRVCNRGFERGFRYSGHIDLECFGAVKQLGIECQRRLAFCCGSHGKEFLLYRKNIPHFGSMKCVSQSDAPLSVLLFFKVLMPIKTQ